MNSFNLSRYSSARLTKTAKGRAEKEGFTEDDANPYELQLGIKAEREHTTNSTLAKQIALDHLCEFPDYYSRLRRMENEAKRFWKNKSKKD